MLKNRVKSKFLPCCAILQANVNLNTHVLFFRLNFPSFYVGIDILTIGEVGK